MTNSLVGDHEVAVINVDEDVLEGFDCCDNFLFQFMYISLEKMRIKGIVSTLHTWEKKVL